MGEAEKRGTHRSEEIREWQSVVTSESPELTRCSSERSDGGCRFINYYNSSHNICSGKTLGRVIKQIDDRIASGCIIKSLI
jgi:hypothetical protein